MRAQGMIAAMLSAWLSVWSACAVTDDVADPATSARDSPRAVIFEEPFDELVPGPIGGQNGWGGNCSVVAGAAPNNYLRCGGGQGASRGLGPLGAGDYTFAVDLSSNINVIDSTHSKVWLEGPQGRVFQIIEGCDNIRVAFQLSGPVAVLASFPCQSLSRATRFRVVCHWAGGGTTLSCGAARLPETPTDFIDLALPSGVRPFDRLEIAVLGGSGASVFDNIFVEQH